MEPKGHLTGLAGRGTGSKAIFTVTVVFEIFQMSWERNETSSKVLYIQAVSLGHCCGIILLYIVDMYYFHLLIKC